MAEVLRKLPFSVSGLTVELEGGLTVATLRYFTRTGDFAQALSAACGAQLPAAGTALQCERGGLILLWRSPTESWCLATSEDELTRLAEQLARAPGGCCVDLTGGLCSVRLSGARIAELLCRLGSSECIPALGQARRGRLADVPVLALSLRPEETRLLVERTYLPHLLGWIRETLFDFSA
jgi:heterotetrameric sarcosine oxidase gamma subunit